MDKISALKSWLAFENDEDIENIQVVESKYDENTFETSFGEYTIYTEDEANEAHQTDLENLIDDLGIFDLFGENADYVIDNYCEWEDGEEYMRDDYESYYRDIESEPSSIICDERLENRQMEELFEALDYGKVDSAEDEEIERFLGDYYEDADELIEKAVDRIVMEYDDPLEWAKSNFGDDFVKRLYKEGLLTVDIDGLSEWIIDTDGRGNSLARWDGVENEYEEYFIYKQDDNCLELLDEYTEDDNEVEMGA